MSSFPEPSRIKQSEVTARDQKVRTKKPCFHEEHLRELISPEDFTHFTYDSFKRTIIVAVAEQKGPRSFDQCAPGGNTGVKRHFYNARTAVYFQIKCPLYSQTLLT